MKTHRNHIVFALALLITCATSLRVLAQPAAPRSLPPATEKQLRALLNDPAVGAAHIGLSIVALGTVDTPQQFPSKPYTEQQRPVLFEVDADKRFLSASNTKLYTAAIALKVLGAEKRFTTRLDVEGEVVDGTLQGGLALRGQGDPSLNYSDLLNLSRQIAARGIKKVGYIQTGSWMKAESFGGRYPDGWTLDDTLWYYGPEIGGLSINRNQTDVTIEGGSDINRPVKVTFDPPIEPGMIEVQVTTGGSELANLPPSLLISYDRGGEADPISGVLRITGKVAPGQKITEGLAIPDTKRWAQFLLKRALGEAGVEVTATSTRAGVLVGGLFPSVRHESAPLRELLRRLLKNSDNLYAEVLLRNAGFHLPLAAGDNPDVSKGTAVRAHRALFDFLRANQIPTAGLNFTDGSGLSRYNLITPRATAQLLAAVERMPDGAAFWDAMPIAGVDGTLRRRMVAGAATNNVRAKTGTFSIVSTLSGYVTTRDSHRLAVSLLTNFAPDGTAVRAWQDRLYTVLAEANWRTAAAN